MEKLDKPNLEYLFDDTIDVKDSYDKILAGENDIVLFKNIATNYVKPDTVILISHDRVENIKALQNVEFNRNNGKYYSKVYGYVHYMKKSVSVLPIVNISERWRGIIILTQHHNLISLESLKDVIEDLNLKLSVDKEKVEEFYNKIKEKEIFGGIQAFVEGVKPINGVVPKVIIDKEIDIIPGLESSDGSIDFKERNFVHNVILGEKIAHYTEAIESKNGIDVYEEVIEATFDDNPNYTLGDNVIVDENGVDILSTVNGVIVTNENVLSVDNTIEINRIDLAIGNIDIQGTIVIKEDVAPGFKVISENDIIVYGSVDDCLISSKGNLAVSGSILGGVTSDIRVAGDVFASSIRNARIFAQGDVTVVNQIINSCIISNGRIITLEGKGTIVGGVVSAKKGVYAKVLGSLTDSTTTVIAGQDLENETKYKKIIKNIKENQTEIARIKALLGNEYFRNPKLFLEKLATGKKFEAYNFIDKIEILSNELKEMEIEKKELYTLFESNVGSVVSIERIIYPGVVVQIGTNKRVITQQLTGTEFLYNQSSKSIFVRAPRKLSDKEYKKFDNYIKHLKKNDRKRDSSNNNNITDSVLEQNPDNIDTTTSEM